MNFIEVFKNKGFQENRWLRRYLKFVSNFKSSSLENTHNHHILPRALLEEYRSFTKYPENKVVLSYRAHLIAHYMLAKAIGGNMWFAYNNMNAHNVKLSTRLYEIAQKNVSIEQSKTTKKWMSENDHPKGFLGKKHSEETRRIIGDSSRGRKCPDEIKDMLSEKYNSKTDEEKQIINYKISKSKNGQTHSIETKEKISKLAKQRYESGFKIILTDEQIANRKKAQKEYFETHDHHTKGKSYEEIMGKEKAKELKKLRSENNPMKNKEYRDKISKAHKGKKLSEETKYKLSKLIPITNDKENKRIDPTLLQEYLENGWRKGYTRKKEEKFTCIHCGKETNKGNLNRWHNNNCKSINNMV